MINVQSTIPPHIPSPKHLRTAPLPFGEGERGWGLYSQFTLYPPHSTTAHCPPPFWGGGTGERTFSTRPHQFTIQNSELKILLSEGSAKDERRMSEG